MVTTITPNYERVTQGMRILRDALGPFIHRELSRVFGGKWYTDGVLLSLSDQARRSLPQSGNTKDLVDELDLAALLTVMDRRWGDVFSVKLPRMARNYVIELINSRNEWAHAGKGDMEEDDAWRVLDTMSRLLEQMKSPEAEEIDKLTREIRQASYTAPTPQAPVAPASQQAAAKSPAPAPSSAPTGQHVMDFGLRPWREVIAPHRDVAEGRYQQAEFAADLAEVVAGKAEPEYQDPAEFFARTYLTEGMSNLLVAALQRLSGKGGEPVVQLKTAFGGGKTHTMLALYHLLRGKGKLDRLAGVRGILEKAGVSHLPKTNVAVLVGTDINPSQPHLDAGGHGIEVRTLWGEMAAQLGGREGYELVRSADEQGVSPGAATLVELFNRFGPCVVLVDELVAYARNIYGVPNLPSGSFEAVLTFVQSLTEAAKRSKASMVVASIPASIMEVGGSAGQEALDRIEKTFGRVEAVWKPVGALEGFEIVRRRLFTPVQDEAAKEQICLAFSRLYSGESTDFPRDCGEMTYLERLRAAYPIHPEVFDRLYDDWATLERFQRTRGVLRLMAACIYELWSSGDRSYLIQPGFLPLDSPRVKDELLRYLPEGWNTVIDRDVDGDRSEPRRIDDENPRYGSLRAAERLARTIFLGSAPHVVEQRVRGVEDARVRLGVAQPGEPIAVFNDALSRLTERLTYLYSANRRYWYDTRPNLTRTAEDRTARYEDYEAYLEIEKRLKKDRERGSFAGVHWCPDPPGADVPDEQSARLVVLKPELTFSRRRNDPPARDAALRILQYRGNSPRQNRNMLAFVAPDEDTMAGLVREAKRYLAWTSIVEDAKNEAINLDTYQRRQATDSQKRADETVDLRIQEAYSWLLVPLQEGGTSPWTLEIGQIPGSSSCVTRASQRMDKSEQLITAWSPALLRMELDRWLWKDTVHIGVKRLWDYLCTYGYLPRLRDQKVLLDAIAQGIRSRDYFAYADSVSGDRYQGVIFGEAVLPSSIHLNEVSVLIKPEVALAQEEADTAGQVQSGSESEQGGIVVDPKRRTDHPGTAHTPAVHKPRLKTRYHASIELGPHGLAMKVSDIANEVIQYLAAEGDVTITLQIDALSADGFSDKVVRDVAENGRTLKFRFQEFEEE